MSFRRHLESFRQDIYAAYCEKNVAEVRLVLNYLRADGLKVYDPALERVPGKFICVCEGEGEGRDEGDFDGSGCCIYTDGL